MAAGFLRRLLRGDPVPEEPFLVRVREGGAESFRRIVFTRNRRVMVSVGDGGATLRVHERLREAPESVQRAIGTLYSRGAAPRKRSQARLAVQEYLRTLSAEPPRPRRRRVPLADRPAIQRLRAEFDRVNAEHFDDLLPAVPITLSGRMTRRNGHFSAQPLEIVVSRRLCIHAADGEAERTLRHEMIHLWQHVNGTRPGHGSDFRRWAERLEVHPRATRTVEWLGGC